MAKFYLVYFTYIDPQIMFATPGKGWRSMLPNLFSNQVIVHNFLSINHESVYLLLYYA